MKKNQSVLALFVFSVFFIACKNDPAPAGDNAENSGTTEVPQGKRSNFEGIYTHEVNTEEFHAGLEIKHTGNDQFNFKIYSATSDGCVSEISGDAAIPAGSSQAVYTTDGCEALTLKFETNAVTVEEKGCDSKHGAKCGFAGKYVLNQQ